jgi:anti-sigma-K factor RskA
VRGDPDGGDVVTTPEMHLDAGALALGALPADELPAVEEHIDTCDSCREELAGFRETVVRLAAVAAEAPPASLRRSVLAAIAVTPQLPPIDRSGASTEPLVGRHREADEPPPTEPGEPAPSRDGDADVPGGAVPDNVRPLRPWYRRPASWIAAAAAAVVLVGGGLVAVNQFRGQQQVAQTPEQCVAAAADRTVQTPEDGHGQVIYAPSCGAVTVDVTGLPALGDDRTYQLWALSDRQQTAPRSMTLLPQAAQGQQQVVTEPTQPGEVQVAITAEPPGGSAAPTTPIVWMASLTP